MVALAPRRAAIWLSSRWAALVGFVLALVVSCVAPQAQAAASEHKTLTVSELPAPDLVANANGAEPEYLIGPLDTLQVTVYPQPELGGEKQVGTDGMIDMPLIGPLKASGLQPRALGRDIAALYGAKYLESPSVTVEVKQSATQNYIVTGSVQKPGKYDVLGEVTLMEAIANGGGVNDFADEHHVIIFRTIQHKRAAAVIDLAEVETGKLDDPRVYPGDVIMVGSSKSKRFLHNVASVTPLLLFLHPLGF